MPTTWPKSKVDKALAPHGEVLKAIPRSSELMNAAQTARPKDVCLCSLGYNDFLLEGVIIYDITRLHIAITFKLCKHSFDGCLPLSPTN
jgi:hypothetical protein